MATLPTHSPTRLAVINALKQNGPMTVLELSEHLQWLPMRVYSVLRWGRKSYPKKMFRISGYKKTDGHGKDQCVYAAQKGPDAQRAVDVDARSLESGARYRRRHGAIINARARTKRAQAAGRTVQSNHWAQLVPAEMRGYAALATNRQMQHKRQGTT